MAAQRPSMGMQQNGIAMPQGPGMPAAGSMPPPQVQLPGSASCLVSSAKVAGYVAMFCDSSQHSLRCGVWLALQMYLHTIIAPFQMLLDNSSTWWIDLSLQTESHSLQTKSLPIQAKLGIQGLSTCVLSLVNLTCIADEWYGYGYATKWHDGAAGHAWSHAGTAATACWLAWSDVASKPKSTGMGLSSSSVWVPVA